MVFEHPSVNRSWVTYKIGKDRSMANFARRAKTERYSGKRACRRYRPVHEKSWRYRSCGSFAPEHWLILAPEVAKGPALNCEYAAVGLTSL
jgi:hypothetical protein